MEGQWLGQYWGTNHGAIALDLDNVRTGYAGAVSVYDQDPGHPRLFGLVELPRNQPRVSLRVEWRYVVRGSGELMDAATAAAKCPGVQVPQFADTEWVIASKEIHVKWKTNIGTHGEVKLVKSTGQEPSALKPLAEVNSWEEFKRFVLTLDPYRFAYRSRRTSRSMISGRIRCLRTVRSEFLFWTPESGLPITKELRH